MIGIGILELAIILLIAVVGIAYLALAIAAIFSVMSSDLLAGAGKAVWVLLIFAFPFLGSLAWFLWGRYSHFDRI